MRMPIGSSFTRLPCFLIVVSTLVRPLVAEDQQSTQSGQQPAPDKQRVSATLKDGVVHALPSGTSEPVSLNAGPTSALSLMLAAARQSDSSIGVELSPVGDVLRLHLRLGEGKGVVVTAVENESPAAKAGIQKNDVLITLGDEDIAGLEGFRKSLEAAAEKHQISIGLIRAGNKQAVEVTPRSSATQLALNFIARNTGEAKFWLGVGLAPADDTLRSQLSLAANEGLVVDHVESDSPAAKAGVMVNDVLLKLDGKALTTIEALTEQIQSIGDKSTSLELLRRGKPASLSVTPEKHDAAWQAVHLTAHPEQDLVFVAPQSLERLWVADTLSQPVNIALNQAKPDLAKQLGDLEAQVKQLEASLAALRGLLDAPGQPAPSAGNK
jgi:membrane-associated protease RseP (regulator of RpoE activity)